MKRMTVAMLRRGCERLGPLVLALSALPACASEDSDELAAPAPGRARARPLARLQRARDALRVAQNAACDGAASCDDGLECTLDACVAGVCVNAVAAGTTCGNGGTCDGAGQCVAGVCDADAICAPGLTCLVGICVAIL